MFIQHFKKYIFLLLLAGLALTPAGSALAANDAVNPYTGKSYTHQEKFADRMILNGIDVSQWQGKSIDWNKVKAAGIEYAFIRVGYRGYGNSGTLGSDLYYDINMKNAAEAGVNTGIYIYSQAITEEEAVEEANYILERIGNYSVTMPLIIDYEYAEDGRTGRLYKAKLSKEEATNVCLAFCQTVADAGYTPMVYANKSMLNDQLNAADIIAKGYRIWLANYTTATDYSGDYDFWQYSDAGKVDGILANTGNPANVDMNFYYAQEADNFMPLANSIALATVAPIPDQIYTGAAITPEITLTYGDVTLVPGQDYSVTYSDNTEPGTAFIKLAGLNQYHGTKTVTFHISLHDVSNFTASKTATNYITLSWNKTPGVTGYQIYRSSALDGEYSLIKTINGNGTTSYKNTKLTAGQCYYYQIRCYKKESSGSVYGDFSPILSVATKASCKRNANAKAGAILYDSASYAANPIATPEKGASMPVTYYTKDSAGTGWYYVTYKAAEGNCKGFVPAEKVTITKVGKIVNYKYVNVRKSASTTSKILTTLKRNKKVTILSSKKKKGMLWYKVTFKKGGKTYKGWISGSYIKIV